MNALSLFSGIGGIDLACEWAGIKTVAFCEREPFPQQVLRKHWPDIPIYDDVCTLTKERLEADGIGTIDLIHGGYPCQPFSLAGKRGGEKDDRHLWPEVRRILSEIRPRWFVGENVAGHVTLGLDDVLSDLENEGYTAQAFVIPACAVYASHRRDRVFIVAHRDGERHDGGGWEVSTVADRDREKDGLLMPDGENVADAEGKRRGERRAEQPRQLRELFAFGGGSSSDSMADTGSAGCQKRDASTFSSGTGYDSRCGDPIGTDRPAQPGMGRDAYELSDWLDGWGMNPLDALINFIASYPQPALMGQPQYDWEPPRVATGTKNRAARLKALGNAVVPQQIYPILAAIKQIDDLMRESAHDSTESPSDSGGRIKSVSNNSA